jgi:alpha-tubulin suppressor-like RCC1 family protein
MAESILLGVLGKDYGDGVFKYLDPRTAACLETTFTRELVFVPLGGAEALLLSVARRRHAEAAEAGATLAVLGEGRDGRATWATELRWIYMGVGRARVGGAKKMISAGRAHSLVTSGKIGEISSFGGGGFGQLGHGGEGHEVVPRLIEALKSVAVKQVATGFMHSMVLTRDGNVFTWGGGYLGQLGHGNEGYQRVPKRVEGLTNVTDIAVGSFHSLAVGEGGAVYTWGYNERGQLGLGDHGYGTNRLVPTEVQGVNEVVAVAAGTAHSFTLSRDGTVMACGWNAYGQLGLGDTDDRDTFTVVAGLRGVVDIDAGWGHSIAVTAEGGLYTWGKGRAIGHGGDEDTQRLVPTKVTGKGIREAVVVQVAAGDHHSMALMAAGQLWTWGDGENGQLGHGGKENLAVPRVVDGVEGAVAGMASGGDHSLVTTIDGRVLAFGSNGDFRDEDSDGEELDEPFFAVEGRLGVGVGVGVALTPTAIDGIVIGREGEEGKEGKEGKE